LHGPARRLILTPKPALRFSIPERNHQMSDLTKIQLIAAIVATIGEDRFAVYGQDGLVAAHQTACLHAFRKSLSGPTIDILREAWDHLETTGRYPFYPEEAES